MAARFQICFTLLVALDGQNGWRRGEAVWAVTVEWHCMSQIAIVCSQQFSYINISSNSSLAKDHRFSGKTATVTIISILLECDMKFWTATQPEIAQARIAKQQSQEHKDRNPKNQRARIQISGYPVTEMQWAKNPANQISAGSEEPLSQWTSEPSSQWKASEPVNSQWRSSEIFFREKRKIFSDYRGMFFKRSSKNYEILSGLWFII